MSYKYIVFKLFGGNMAIKSLDISIIFLLKRENLIPVIGGKFICFPS